MKSLQKVSQNALEIAKSAQKAKQVAHTEKINMWICIDSTGTAGHETRFSIPAIRFCGWIAGMGNTAPQ